MHGTAKTRLITISLTWVFDERTYKCLGMVRPRDGRRTQWLTSAFDEIGQLYEVGVFMRRSEAIKVLYELENKKCNTTPK